MVKVLIADDEESVINGLALVLQHHQPETALNRRDAIKILSESSINLLISDLYFPELEDGLSLIREAKEISPDTFIVVLTGYGSIETAVQAIKSGADDYLTKGIPPDELKIKIDRFIKIAKERRELTQLKTITTTERTTRFELVGESAIVRDIKNKIEQVSKEDKVPVLITGETGTGKEVCARMIHNLGPRKEKPFLAIDSPTIPENLFESELFGYEKGAFTDARNRKMGKIELAHQGTLFLDEIGDMPLSLQPKLLRFLETNEFFRLGGTRPITVDTRIIVSTNQDLEELIKAKKFREDIYYRLKVFTIKMPPLRERKEDIPLLVAYFLNFFDPLRKKHGLFSERLISVFQQYYWPGNVRELKNIVECLLLTENEEEILRLFDYSQSQHSNLPFSKFSYRAAKKEAINRFECNYFQQMLQQEQWNITRAAKRMGISREELHRKIKRLGIKKSL